MVSQQIRVLLVEDSQSQRQLIQTWLAAPSSTTFHVECCASLAAAIQRLGRTNIDVVLLDLVLPDGGGLDTCAKVLQVANGCPVVVLSAIGDEDVALNALRFGAQDYLVKGDVDARSLRRALRYAIERKAATGEVGRDVPTWDAQLRELRRGRILIKRFRQPSSTQEVILSTFQEESWPPRIDDPLPPAADHDPKIRLRSTIKSLNRNQHHSLIRFYADGTGQAVLWEFLFPSESDGTTAALPRLS